jgi:hypothetical protein
LTRAVTGEEKPRLWTCEELRIPYERIDAGGAFGRTSFGVVER